MKKILALLTAMMLLLSACSSATADGAGKEVEDAESQSQENVSVPDPNQEPTEDTVEAIDFEQVYRPILDMYETALLQGYNIGQLEDAGLNYLCAYYDASELGYAFLDTDQNGIPELLIGAIGEEDFFFDLYTAIEEIPILVAQSSERDRYYLCSDGAIANEGSSSAFNSTYAYYNIGEQGQLILSEAVIYDEDYSSDSLWYSTSAVSAEGASPLSRESAELIFKKHGYVMPDYTPFFPDGI